jgi:hypothetical protein
MMIGHEVRIGAALIALLVVSMLGAKAAAQETTPNAGVSAPLAACIRSNAVSVERAIDALPQAVDFLILKVCAVEATAEDRVLRAEAATRARQTLKQKCDEARTSASSRRTRGEAELSYCSFMVTQDMFGADGAMTVWSGSDQVATTQARPEAVALAAKLLLESRLARSSGSR